MPHCESAPGRPPSAPPNLAGGYSLSRAGDRDRAELAARLLCSTTTERRGGVAAHRAAASADVKGMPGAPDVRWCSQSASYVHQDCFPAHLREMPKILVSLADPKRGHSVSISGSS